MTEISRVVAVQILKSCIDDNKELDAVLNNNPKYAKLQSNDKGFVMLLVNECFRHIGQLDVIIDEFLSHPDRIPADVRYTLRVAAAEHFFTKSPVYAVVNNAVNAVVFFKQVKLKGLTNAVVRKITKLDNSALDKVPAEKNFPTWLIEAWTKQYGEEKSKEIAENSLRRYPLYVSVKSDAEKWEKELNAKQVMPNLLRCEDGMNVPNASGFGDGEWWVQGFEASLPARILGDLKGKKVLDCCAAPGGKTAQLASAGAKVIALEKSPLRIKRLRENIRRLNLDAKAVEADAILYNAEKNFDAILIDAPCSSTGTIRKNPDVLYNKTYEQIHDLRRTQKGILENVSKLVKVGGHIVYATCSLQKEEGEYQINDFLRLNDEFKLSKIRGKDFFGFTQLINKDGMVRAFPQTINKDIESDGFFIARIERVK
jgi:16S rRNA (cytosine967-C5)-methyltransferase